MSYQKLVVLSLPKNISFFIEGNNLDTSDMKHIIDSSKDI